MKKKINLFLSNKKMQIVLLLIILIIVTLCLIVNKNGFIGNIARNIKGELEEPEVAELFTYTMYDNQDEDKIKVLVKVQSEDGLDYIETPDNHKIQCNGKKAMALDYEVQKDEDYIFKVKESNKDVQEQNLRVDDTYIHDKILNFSNTTERTGKTTIKINRYMDFDDFVTYCKFGENGEWEQCEGEITKDDFQDFYKNNLLNNDGTITTYVKISSNKNSNQIILNNEKYYVFLEDGLLQILQNADIKDNGYFETTINTQTYSMHTYVFNGDQEWKNDQIFGDESDIGKAGIYAKNMILVKVNGNLTIEEGVTVTTYHSSYGGPKGILLYVTGNIVNKGTISMTARGAYAKGQDIYLWDNNNANYEYVPAIGAEGGQAKTLSFNGGNYGIAINGNNGKNGSNRQTGGGGTGSGRNWMKGITIGKGATGTSYSGGSGSGAANSDGGNHSGWAISGNAAEDGGSGSNGDVRSGNNSGYGQISMGGTGNPSGNYASYRIGPTNYIKREGTGGLLIMYSNNFTNNGTIEANGVSSSTGKRPNTNGRIDPGGASGGGSINIFYKGECGNKGTITANGGAAITGEGGNTGGAGGNGTVSIGCVGTGTYVSYADD